MPVQDDAREQELCNLFNLDWDPTHARAGTDARFVGQIAGQLVDVPFEVKSSTGHSVSTSRDVGMGHIRKWREKHWVFGFYDARPGQRPRLKWSLYVPPRLMAPWIDKLESYIRPDQDLATIAPDHLSLDDLHRICGEKERYELKDAKRLHKKQFSSKEYKEKLDVTIGRGRFYSPSRMLEILRLRARYLMERGATLNNPHIPAGFFDQFSDDQRILRNHAAILGSRLEAELSLLSNR